MKHILALGVFLVAASCAATNTGHSTRPGKVAVIGGLTETVSNVSANAYSTPIDCTDSTFVGYAIRTTGTLAGSWSFLYSNDYVPGVDSLTSEIKWDTYTLDTTPPAALGAPETTGLVVDFFEMKYGRVKFTYSSGSGSIFFAGRVK